MRLSSRACHLSRDRPRPSPMTPRKRQIRLLSKLSQRLRCLSRSRSMRYRGRTWKSLVEVYFLLVRKAPLLREIPKSTYAWGIWKSFALRLPCRMAPNFSDVILWWISIGSFVTPSTRYLKRRSLWTSLRTPRRCSKAKVSDVRCLRRSRSPKKSFSPPSSVTSQARWTWKPRPMISL